MGAIDPFFNELRQAQLDGQQVLAAASRRRAGTASAHRSGGAKDEGAAQAPAPGAGAAPSARRLGHRSE